MVVWDLRKQKIVATLHSPSTSPANTDIVDEVGQKTNGVYALTFDPSGKILACGTSNNEILIMAVKYPENVVALTDREEDDKNNQAKNGKICGLVWDGDGPSPVSCSDTERHIKFWGALRKDP